MSIFRKANVSGRTLSTVKTVRQILDYLISYVTVRINVSEITDL